MSDQIAIVGMAGRFPGAADLAEFWSNLRSGTESISFLSEPELAASVLVPPRSRQHPDFVPAAGILAGADLFDHGFFGMSLREARWTDPQQRVFLELAWAALEDAGIDPRRAPGRVSVYAGAANSGHLLGLLGELGDDPASLYEAMGSATADNLATWVAFALRLRGEAVTVHTACSTGLAAVHAGCQSLLLGQSTVAIAGAVRIALPQHTGYVYQEGMILSRDGHCRAFDATASGTVPGNGAGVVVLRPLADALAAGDHIYAVIKGSAINNDGHRGVGYTAPSVPGQAEVIAEAMEFAGASGNDIGYVEAHGTGTPLGDPIEIAALTRAYRASTARVGDCPVGSVKSNIGHLDTAAGMAGLIKVALMLHHGEIPATLHVSRPNPAIDFADSPFHPNTERRAWPRGQRPRLAGVSSFGIGGTNVHAVLEEAPVREASASSPRRHQLVTLSARTPAALAMMATDLAAHLERAPADLADVAFTRAVGRAAFDHRRTVVAADPPELVAALRKPAQVAAPAVAEAQVVFLFPGQGAASYGMAGALYDAEPVFAEELDLVLATLQPHLDRPLLPALRDGDGPMLDPQLAHPALFAVEYALARTWMRWGVQPHALLGHSFGEYAAACVAGIWKLDEAARLAVLRGRLVARMPEGAMLAVALDETAIRSYLDGEVAVAAVNGDGRCVISGPPQAVAATADRLAGDGVATVPLPVRYAFHSAAVEPVLAELKRAAAACDVSPPAVPVISSLTGSWWNGDDGTPDYWARQMREPVRFATGLQTAVTAARTLFVEVGPDQALTTLARAQLRDRATAVASLRRLGGTGSDQRVLLEAVGALWRAGVAVDWLAFYEPERRHRVPLPPYRFERVDCSLPAGTPVELPTVTTDRAVSETPEPQPEDAGEDTTKDTAADEIERKVLLIWQERLGSTDFGVHDNFLELGGNSLMAAQMLTRLRDAFSVQLPMSALFDSPTVTGVAQQIRTLLTPGSSGTGSAPAAGDLPPLRPVARNGLVALSVVQERTLALEAADPGNPALLMPVTVTMDGPLDPDRLREAAARVAARHETLRTTFHREGGRWLPRIGDHRPGIALAELPPGADPAEWARSEAAQPIDLSMSALRMRLLRLAPSPRTSSERHILLLTLHHVISDTWSMLVFLRELAAAYEDGPLPPVTIQYPDFAAWQRQNLAGSALAAQREYWRRTLKDAPPPLALPVDFSRAHEVGCHAGRIDVALPAATSQRVRDFCQGCGVTPFVAILAGYTALLARVSGGEDIIVGTPIGNRERPELEGLIGYVAHCVPLRTRLTGDPHFWELTQRVKQTLLSAYEHPDLPYEHLIADRPGRLFSDAGFVLHSGIDSELRVAGMTWRPWDVPGLPAQFGATLSPLTLMLADRPDGFTGVLEYATDLFTEATAHRLAGQLATLLDDATRHPRTPVSHLDLATVTGGTR